MFNFFKNNTDNNWPSNKEFNGNYHCLCVKSLFDSAYNEDGTHKTHPESLYFSDRMAWNYFMSIPEPDHIDFEDVRICLKRPERLNEKISAMLKRHADNATV